MMAAAEQAELLARVAKGDRLAFGHLYEATCAKLYGVVLRILRRLDLAEEVMQDTYVRIWRTAGEFNPTSGTPITWMVAIARSRALDLVRTKSEIAIEDESSALGLSDDPDPLNPNDMSNELRRLLACLGDLEEERRRLVLFAYYSGWSRDQLGVTFSATADTVKNWLRQSLMQIRECLGS
ncbi:MAG TPA: sigma-70 family RNA polymerase sigma factor [Xanthobacteraceae bacterium]|jgi:RNA polymerase sigma-70 factor (ECF subfamily)|nr:sigma-70 family RNA polymerase sigma factor [Xanthobacteraceae bacterium]